MASAQNGNTPYKTILEIVGNKRPVKGFLRENNPNKLLSNLNKLSQAEINQLSNKHFVSRENARKQNNNLNTNGILSYFAPSHVESVSFVQDAERLKCLAPEITQAELILVSSIMSPNDLQDGNPSITISDISDIDENVITKVENYLSTYFNEKYKLGKKMTEWCREAKFRSGAAVTLLLPEASLTKAIEPIREDILLKKGTGKEVLGEYNTSLTEKDVLTYENYCKLLDIPVFSKQSPKPKSNYKKDKNKDKEVAVEDLFPFPGLITTTINNLIEKDLLDPVVLVNKSKNRDYSNISSAIEAMTATIKTKIEDGDTIKISENPEILRFGKAVRNYEKNKLGKDCTDLYNPFPYGKHGGKEYNKEVREEILDYTKYLDNDANNTTMPFSISIPTESVIPVCVPGNNKEKLGYFILINDTGHPIDASTYVLQQNPFTNSGRIGSGYNAIYGNSPTPGGMSSPILNNTNLQFNTGRAKPTDVMNEVFNYVLDDMLRNKLKNVGLREVDFDKYETIATCMFYRMLENKHTSLVFVPESIVTYVAFDYRPNGCGKSLLEDISFILSLRVTLLVANMMAMMKNAIAKKDVNVTFDEMETNIDQALDIIKEVMVEKNKLSFSTDPAAVVRDMSLMNLNIKANGVPNAPGLSVDVTDTQNQIPRADSELSDTIDRLLGLQLGVPPATLNALSENEYSRTVATGNIFFSKQILNNQITLCEFTTEHVQTYVSMSSELTAGISKLLGDDNNPSPNDKELVKDGGTNIHNEPISISNTVYKIIKSIKVSLPKPNIAPNKAQFDVLRETLDLVTQLTDLLYPNELLHENDAELTSALNLVKAMTKRNLTRDFIDSLGVSNVLNIESIEDFSLASTSTILDVRRILENLTAAIKKDKTARTTPTEDASSTDGDDSFGSDSSGMGDDSSGMDFSNM